MKKFVYILSNILKFFFLITGAIHVLVALLMPVLGGENWKTLLFTSLILGAVRIGLGLLIGRWIKIKGSPVGASSAPQQTSPYTIPGRLADSIKEPEEETTSPRPDIYIIETPMGQFTTSDGVLTKYTGHPDVTDITIPASIKGIGNCVFQGCENIRHVTIPENLDYIGTLAFGGCTNLQSVTIKGIVRKICPRCFYGCASLQTVAFLQHIPELYEESFSDCPELTLVVPFDPDGVPDGIDVGYYLNELAFDKTPGLIGITDYQNQRQPDDASAHSDDSEPHNTQDISPEGSAAAFVMDIHSVPLNEPWIRYDILLPFAYGWEHMIRWADLFANDDMSPVITVTHGFSSTEAINILHEYIDNGFKCSGLPNLEEEGAVLSIGGYSKTLGCQVQIVWFNQTRIVRVMAVFNNIPRIRNYAETVLKRTSGAFS